MNALPELDMHMGNVNTMASFGDSDLGQNNVKSDPNKSEELKGNKRWYNAGALGFYVTWPRFQLCLKN